VVEVTKRDPIQ
jgi:hypothetical protein